MPQALLSVGWFREFGGNEERSSDNPSIRDFINPEPQPDERRIVHYLRSGVLIGVSSGYDRDVLNPAAGVILPQGFQTDGLYFWPVSLPYYVETYHLLLPNEFLEYMRKNDWTVPGEAEEIALKVWE